jgi:ribosomal protein L37AE/L43A
MSDFEKPSNVEDEYFAREDVEHLHRLAVKASQEMAAKEKEDLKKLHHMHCPKCGMDLHTLRRGQVEVDTCFNCQGVWLDKGKLETLMTDHERNGSRLMEAVLNIFQRWTPAGKKR